MRIFGIDPSFTRTGLCILADGVVEAVTSVEVPSVVKSSSIFHLGSSFPAALWHARQCREFLAEYDDMADAVFVEAPAVGSASGGYLLPLQSMLYSEFGSLGLGVLPFYLLPPSAINSLVLPKKSKKKLKPGEIPEKLELPISKAQAKGMIVSWVEERYGVSLNHDEASAVVLAHIGAEVLSGKYKKSYSLCERWYNV